MDEAFVINSFIFFDEDLDGSDIADPATIMDEVIVNDAIDLIDDVNFIDMDESFPSMLQIPHRFSIDFMATSLPQINDDFLGSPLSLEDLHGPFDDTFTTNLLASDEKINPMCFKDLTQESVEQAVLPIDQVVDLPMNAHSPVTPKKIIPVAGASRRSPRNPVPTKHLTSMLRLSSLDNSSHDMIGAYTREARLERLERFREKRKQRVWEKRVKYDCRKTLAVARPRYKGRFVKVQIASSTP